MSYNKRMKNNYFLIIVLILFFAFLGIYLGWLDNGPWF